MLKIFTPKWQSDDPEIRKEAIAEISEEETLLEILNTDDNVEVQKLAIKKIDTIATLLTLHQQTSTRALADERLRHEINARAGEIEFSQELAKFLSECDDEQLGRHVASNNSDDQFAALGDCSKLEPQQLIQLCSSAATSIMRQRAATALEEEHDLKLAIKQAAHKDKNVSHILRDKMAVIKDTQNKQKEVDQLLETLEKLGSDHDWQQDQSRLDKHSLQWDLLRSSATPDQISLWQLAFKKAEQRVNANKAEADAILPVIEEKESLCQQADSFGECYEEKSLGKEFDAAELLEKLTGMEINWDKLPALVAHKEEEYKERFSNALKQHQGKLKLLAKDWDLSKGYDKLLAQAKQLQKRKQLKEKDIDRLEGSWNELTAPEDQTLINATKTDFYQAIDKLKSQYQKLEESKEKALTKIDQNLTEMESELANDQTKKAGDIYRKIEQLLQQTSNVPNNHRKAIEKRLHKHRPVLRELEGWRHWGTDKAREALIKEAKALAKADIDVKKRAKELKNLRDKWKKLGEMDPISAQRLWKKFDAACTEAHQPIKQARKEDNAARDANLKQRVEICSKLEKMETETNWDDVAWREIDKGIGKLRNAWRSSGPVRSKKWNKINERFNKAMETLDVHLDDERRRSINLRNGLIAKVEAALELTDMREATNIAKQAQRDWVPTVLARRSEEQKLWKQFRAAVDQIFDKDKQEKKAHYAANDALLKQKKAIVSELEKISKLKGSDLSAAQADAGKLKGQWDELEHVRDKRSASVDQRYRKACQQLERGIANQATNSKAEQLGHLLDGKYEGDPVTADENVLQTALIELEIILELETPAAQSKNRMQLQVERMADAMSSGASQNNSTEIKRLCEKAGQQIKAGASVDDLAERVSAIKSNLAKALGKSA